MDRRKRLLRYLPHAIGAVLTLILAVALYVIQDKFDKPVQPKKQVQQITMIKPPPPPPPPPPEEKPPEPEPEKIEEPEPEEEPEPSPEESDEPAGEELGLDAEGGAGSDGFGLLGKKGGRGLLGGGGGNSILWYGGQVKRGLEEDLQRLLADSSARRNRYTVQLNIWIGSEGMVSRAELVGSSGMQDIDSAIEAVLPRLKFSVGKPPPENMPQPLKVRVSSRM